MFEDAGRLLALIKQHADGEGGITEDDLWKLASDFLNARGFNVALNRLARQDRIAVEQAWLGRYIYLNPEPLVKQARKAKGRQSRELTPLQTRAVQLDGECNGNISEAARRMGVDRKTYKQHLDAAYRKLGRLAPMLSRTTRLPKDKRGQERVTKDKRRD